jgi:hypothetical protein
MFKDDDVMKQKFDNYLHFEEKEFDKIVKFAEKWKMAEKYDKLGY